VLVRGAAPMTKTDDEFYYFQKPWQIKSLRENKCNGRMIEYLMQEANTYYLVCVSVEFQSKGLEGARR